MSALLYRIGPIWWLELNAGQSFHAARVLEFETAKQARHYARKLGIPLKRAANCDREAD
jgi:hypothetical protein